MTRRRRIGKWIAWIVGSDKPSDWKWGDYHQLTFDHPLSGASPIFAYFLNPKPVPIGGSNISVQAVGFTEDGSIDHGASWRFVADLQDLSSAHHIVGI